MTLGCTLALAVGAWFLNPTRLHLSGLEDALNDQVGYISVARTLADTGVLRSTIVYPATLAQPGTRTYLYMPGHYVVLAAAYRLFGFGVWQSLLPNVAAFVVTALLAYVIGRRLYDRQTGLVAAFLFILFPANVVFALTAMGELTLVAASTLAVAGFVYLRPAWRPYLGPVLLVLPFLFRETSAFLAAALATALFLDSSPRRVVRVLFFLVASVVLLHAVFRSDVSAGRPGLNAYEVDEATGLAKYQDATIRPKPPSLPDWARAIAANVANNLSGRLLGALAADPSGLERLSITALGFAIVLVIAYGFAQRGREWLPLACGVVAGITVSFVVGFYAVDRFRGVRALLFVYPLIAVSLARVVRRADLLPSLGQSGRARLAVNAVLAALLVFANVKTMSAVGREYVRADRADDATANLLESIGHDDTRLLVAPFWLALPYVQKHHPVRWSFVPANAYTLALVAKAFEVGTVVLPARDYGSSLTEEDLHRLGLRRQGLVDHEGDGYLIFRRDHGQNG